jgi:solute:Na+ symporter, SSS family
VNDFYKRFFRPHATERHYVTVSRVTTVLLFLASILVARNIDSVGRAWQYLLALGAGTGLVLILRWYWWRINAWSEISAMVASFVVGLTALWLIPPHFAPDDPNAQAWVMVVTVALSTAVWVAVTFATAPEPAAVLEAFYRRVRPGGPGWRAVAERAGFGREPIAGGALAWTNWVAGIVAAYSTLFGIGKVVFGETGPGVALLLVAAAAFAWIARSFRGEGAGSPTVAVPPAVGYILED